jgi:hypothetical protein
MTFKEFVSREMPNFDWNWHHNVICKSIDEWLTGDHNLMILAPPRSSKSTLCSIALPAFLYEKYPELNVMSVSHNTDLALQRSRDIRKMLNIIPAKRPEGLQALGNLRFHGVENITGRGYHVGILDDIGPYSDSISENKHIWEWYCSVFMTRRLSSSNTRNNLVISSLTSNSIIPRILQNAKDSNEVWTVVRIQALRSPVVTSSDRLFESYWENRMPIDGLLNSRKILGDVNFRMLYQQELI